MIIRNLTMKIFYLSFFTSIFLLISLTIIPTKAKEIYLRNCESHDDRIDVQFPNQTLSFRLEKSIKPCFANSKSVKMDLSKLEVNDDDNEWNIPILNTNHTASLYSDTNGTILISTIIYEKSNYCIRKIRKQIVSFEVCCAEGYVCVRKCCQPGEAIKQGENFECRSGEKWNPPLHHKPGNQLSQIQQKKIEMSYILGFDCTLKYFTDVSTVWNARNSSGESFVVLKNGRIQYLNKLKRKWEHINDSVEYCMDKLESDDEGQNKSLKGTQGESGILLLCVPKLPDDNGPTSKSKLSLYDILYTVCFIIAMLFLLATAVVKFLLWEKQNIHSWTILGYVLSLFLLYFCLTLINLTKNSAGTLNSGGCIFLGVMTHFFAFCTFCWLSVINFDLWWTFRVLNPVNDKTLDIKRFLSYCAFAILLPILMVSVALGLQFSYKSASARYGAEECFLSKDAMFAYFYGPLGFLLAVNLIFYITTTCRMFTLYKTSRRASETSTKKQRQSCRLFLKLFIVAGLTWSFEFIFWIAEGNKKKWYWILLDMANILQAIAIFVIFVCKRETVRSLEQKYPSLKGTFGVIARFTKTPNFAERSTDGSTKVSRTELSKTGISTDSIHRQESIELS